MDAVQTLLAAIAADPADDAAWLALADCLEEHGRADEAELTRLREGLRRLEPKHPERKKRQTRLQALLAAGVRPVLPRREVALSGTVEMDFVLIPPGTFCIGSPPREKGRTPDEGRQHAVTITAAFWAGVCPVTQRQWEALMRKNPSDFQGSTRPVDSISWFDCQKFCQRLGKRAAAACRLPTEVEWEYACRAGTTSAYANGNDLRALLRAGWFEDNSDGQTQPVAQKEPNAWGLYDMHGNVWEWCQDRHAGYDGPDPVSFIHQDPERTVVQRGGSWWNRAAECRSAVRCPDDPETGFYTIGFRVVLPC